MKKQLPQQGQRVKCVFMLDEHPVESSMTGTVLSVDKLPFAGNTSNIHVKWDNGRTLALIEGVDEWEVIDNVQQKA